MITNNGRSSASDFRLTINPRADIVSYGIPFYAENITSKLENPRLLTFYAERLAPGGIINIETVQNSTKVNNTTYRIFATYDQGSIATH
jgi:hypothetical protein